MLSASRCRKDLFRNIKYEIILDVFKSTHLQAYEKGLSETQWLRKNNQQRPPKLSVPQKKRNILRQTKRLQEEMGNFFVKKRVLVKASIPSSFSEETVRRILRKIDLKLTHFQRKGIMSKNDLKLRLKFVWEVYRKRPLCNYEIWNQQKDYGTREIGS